jgi:titin
VGNGNFVDFARYSGVPAGVTTFVDRNLTPGTTYIYEVRANNTLGSSGWSNTAGATTLPGPPAAPTGLVAKVNTATQITLTWIRNSTDETNFSIWRQVGNGDFARYSGVPAGVTTFVDRNLTPSTAYSYQVRANNARGSSNWSNPATGTTLPLPPTSPSGLTATANSPTQITITWTDNSSNETSFAIWRKIGNGDFARYSGTPAGTTKFVDKNLSPNTTYTYEVRANNTGGVSDWSNTAGATTPAGP